MRTIIVTIITLLSLTVRAQQAVPSVDQLMQEATAEAAKDNKKVFIIFHASWCHWCHVLDSAMNDASCKKAFTDNYVIRHITVMETAGLRALENPGGQEMLAKYHGEKQGIPFWLIFDAKGALLADCLRKDPATGRLNNIGYPEGTDLDHFLDILQRTSNMSAADLAAVKKRFSHFR